MTTCLVSRRPRLGEVLLITLLLITLDHVTCQVANDDIRHRHIVNGCKVLPVTVPVKMDDVTNPNYPGFTYLNRSRCWILHMAPTLSKDHYLRLTLWDLDLHVPGDCTAAETDFVEFREGQLKTSPLIGRWCNGWIENDVITSCSADVLVWLHVSQASATRRGFNLTYMALPKDKYDCKTKSVAMVETTDLEDGAIAGVAIFLLLAVAMVAVIVVLKTRQRPNNPDDRVERRNSFWTQSSFDHHRFENESVQSDTREDPDNELVPPRVERSPSIRSGQFSDIMCESKPLPIGIPRAYRADGFPASYACNVPQITVKDVDLEFDEAHPNNPEEGREATVAAENPLYKLSFPDQSGLPLDPPPSEPQDDPLAASLPTGTSGLQLGLALEDRLTGQGQMSRSAPGDAGQGVILPFDRNDTNDESFA